VRRLAAEGLRRIDAGGAYANLVLPHLLAESDLDQRDRAFATELVYGATRMRRSLDWLVDRFLVHDPDPQARALLRLGAYQLVFLRTPAHAAVDATVAAAPKRLRGLVNAVLRKVAAEGEPAWPDEATRLSYPSWLVERMTVDLGSEDALAALAAMDEAAGVTTREDGYVQDQASQWVADAVGARAGERILDACSAPGGKATLLAEAGATVVAGDLRASRLGLVVANAERLGLLPGGAAAVAGGAVHPVRLDASAPPFGPASFDRILLDAPCSGLGSLRRRPDARWRIEPDAVERLAALQRTIVAAAVPLLRPGGLLVYSACTLTAAETTEVDGWLAAAHPELEPAGLPDDAPWRPVGRGGLLLPQDAGTDGMYLLRLRAPGVR
jgi:16S rRNA (cytosine967-C5)-methyltransferase